MEQLHPALRAQMAVRHNAEVMGDYLRDLGKWEKDIKERDDRIRAKKERRRQAVPGVRAGGGVVPVRSTRGGAAPPPPRKPKAAKASRPAAKAKAKAPAAAAAAGKAGSAAAHTYDVGYKKWEDFDVDAALNDVEEDAPADEEVVVEAEADPAEEENEPPRTTGALTPADVVARAAKAGASPTPRAVPAPRQKVDRGDAAEAERQAGNAAYKAGDFAGAIKCYTRSIALNGRSALAFSNRCQAFLKLKEWRRAETDAGISLRIDSGYAKSYLRRAAARSGQGKYRAALLDCATARKLAESDTAGGLSVRAVLAEERSARESLRACVRRAPKARVAVCMATGPALPPPAQPAPAAAANPSPEPSPEPIPTPNANPNPNPSPKPSPSPYPEPTPTPAPPAAETTRAVPPAAPSPETKSKPKPKPKAKAKAPPIKTGYDLEVAFRDAQGDAAALARLVRRLKPTAVPKILRASAEPDVIFGVINALPQAFLGKGDAKLARAAELLLAIVGANAYGMAKLLAAEDVRAETEASVAALAEALDAAAFDGSVALAAQLADLQLW